MVSLEPLGKDLFVVNDPVARAMGAQFTTRMTVARLRDGSRWIASAVQVLFTLLPKIIALGRVCYVVSPRPATLAAECWRALFPDAELFSSPITPITLKQGELPLAGILEEMEVDLWAPDLEQDGRA
ncbi:hypothetical protein [Arthrobacter polaris]|uniref:hypothetical protein n=1 Tax=Arthrobacter polaris TaxID=2813727 RepID=UPI001F399684|nr:hypothetical protein [Arthrobacter polaris]UIK89202.1 hypothetical protein J0916_01585 [Arthrobacter polaris]